MGFRTSETTPATKWVEYSSASLPKVFGGNVRRPKAIMIRSPGNVVLKDEAGTSVTFTLAVGVPIPLRPTEIVSSTTDPVIALFD